jgi:RNA polymerase sigma-70 factor, ECF subfamily
LGGSTVFLIKGEVGRLLFRRGRKQFEDLVLGELEALFRLGFRLTGNRSTAEDLVQETMLRAYRAFDQVQIREYGLKPWLFKILHHIYFNERLAEKRHPVLKSEPTWELLADQHHDWPEVDIDHINWEQFDEEIKQGVEALAPEYRIVLLLWALEQLNYQEIAHVCNIPVGTVMSRLFRARKDLAEKLAEYGKSHHLSRTTPIIKHNHHSQMEETKNGLPGI